MWEKIYEQLKENGLPVEIHPRGMYVPITKESQSIIEQCYPKLNVGVIYHRVEHQNWYNIVLAS